MFFKLVRSEKNIIQPKIERMLQIQLSCTRAYLWSNVKKDKKKKKKRFTLGPAKSSPFLIFKHFAELKP